MAFQGFIHDPLSYMKILGIPWPFPVPHIAKVNPAWLLKPEGADIFKVAGWLTVAQNGSWKLMLTA